MGRTVLRAARCPYGRLSVHERVDERFALKSSIEFICSQRQFRLARTFRSVRVASAFAIRIAEPPSGPLSLPFSPESSMPICRLPVIPEPYSPRSPGHKI